MTHTAHMFALNIFNKLTNTIFLKTGSILSIWANKQIIEKEEIKTIESILR